MLSSFAPPVAEHEDLCSACVHSALDQSAQLARRLVGRAGRSIAQAAAIALDEDERRWLFDAGLFLSRHQDALGAAFPRRLGLQFAAPGTGDVEKPRALSFDSLELMAEDQVDETIVLVRAQQSVLSAVEAELAPLNALISGAQGLRVVRATANPLRPEAWVTALRAATLECPVPAAVRVRWMHHLSDALGAELPALYRQLCDQMREQGVAPAAFGVSTASQADGRPAAVLAPGATDVAPAAAQPHSFLNLRDLRRLLVGNGPGPARRSGSDSRPSQALTSRSIDTGLTVPAAFEALQELKQVDRAFERLQRRRAIDEMAGQATLFTDGGHVLPPPRTPAEALSLEVVRLMVENIASDVRLLPSVRQAVRDLEPALLRLALNDPRFFNDRTHPARQLLDEMTQRSLAWASAELPGFGKFFEPLRQAVEVLAALRLQDAEPFAFALHSLRQAWAEQAERERRRRARAARALVQAEKRNLLAEQIAKGLRARPDMAAASGEIRRFVIGPWAQVMAAARLAGRGQEDDPGGYAGIINDLIWTGQPRLAAANPNRLARLVPPLLATLRRGLASIDFPADAAQRFLAYLANVHQMALRPLAEQEAAAPVAETQPAAIEGWPERAPWLAPNESRDSGLMDRYAETVPDQQLLAATLAPSDSEAPGAQAAAAAPSTGLHPGGWAELFVDGEWSRWQLAWTSPHSTLHLFTDGAGKSRSMSTQMLDKMTELGALRMLSDQTVLEGALDAVARTALLNSTNTLV